MTFKQGFMYFSKTISSVVNFVLLFIIYIFGIGVVSIIAKICGKHFIKYSYNKDITYWEELNLGKKYYDEYKKEF